MRRGAAGDLLERIPTRLLRAARPIVAAVVLLGTGLAQVPSGPPTPGEEAFSEAVRLIREGRLTEAEAAFRLLLKTYGSTPFIHHNLGAVYQQGRRHEAAVEEFRRSLELEPDQPGTRVLLGSSYLSLGRLDDAVRELERAEGKLPDDPSVLELLSRALARQGRLLEATSRYSRLARLRPDDPEVAFRLGQLYQSVSEWSFQRLAEAAPESARVHQAAAQNSLMRGDLERAVSSYRHAIERVPEMPDLHLSLAGVYVRQGKLREALDAVNEELRLVPSNAGARQLKAQLEARLAEP
jgi:tetratricopeptide (TPR) repeat protein